MKATEKNVKAVLLVSNLFTNFKLTDDGESNVGGYEILEANDEVQVRFVLCRFEESCMDALPKHNKKIMALVKAANLLKQGGIVVSSLNKDAAGTWYIACR